MALASTKNLVYQTNKTIDKMIFDQLRMNPSEWDKIANVVPTFRGAAYTEAEISGLGALQQLNEGQPISYDNPVERAPVNRTATMYALGFQYTLISIQDELFGKIKKMAKSLGRSAAVKPDTVFWDLFNNGFGTHTAIDGNFIFVASGRTTLKSGDAQNNRPSSDAALSQTTLESGIDYFNSIKTPEGFPAFIKPKYLIVPATGSTAWQADVLMGTAKKPGSMDNDINTVNNQGLQVFKSRYLTSSTAWFLVGDMHDFNLSWKMKTTHSNTDDFQTGNFLHRVMQRFAVWCNDPTGCYGTTGA